MSNAAAAARTGSSSTVKSTADKEDMAKRMPDVGELAWLTRICYIRDINEAKAEAKQHAPAWRHIHREAHQGDYGMSVDIWQNDDLRINFAAIRGTAELETWIANAGLVLGNTPSWFHVIRDRVHSLKQGQVPYKGLDPEERENLGLHDLTSVVLSRGLSRNNSSLRRGSLSPSTELSAKQSVDDLLDTVYSKAKHHSEQGVLAFTASQALAAKQSAGSDGSSLASPSPSKPARGSDGGASDGGLASIGSGPTKPTFNVAASAAAAIASATPGAAPTPVAPAVAVSAPEPAPAPAAAAALAPIPEGTLAGPPPLPFSAAQMTGAGMVQLPGSKIDYQLIMGGHSLGACIAELIAVDKDVPAVTFESPGIVGLDVLVHNQDTDADEKTLREARAKNRIVSFLSGPNVVNTLHAHPGAIFRLYVPITKGRAQTAKRTVSSAIATLGRIGAIGGLVLAGVSGFGLGATVAAASAAAAIGTAAVSLPGVTIMQHGMRNIASYCFEKGMGYMVQGYDPKNPKAPAVDASQLRVKVSAWPDDLPSLTRKGLVTSIGGLLNPLGKANHGITNCLKSNEVFERYNASMPGYVVEKIGVGEEGDAMVAEAVLKACTWTYTGRKTTSKR